MVEFCKCGSMMIEGNCTNKHCSNRLEKVTTPKKRATRTKSTSVVKAEPQSTKVRRASKCITYSINDLPKEE